MKKSKQLYQHDYVIQDDRIGKNQNRTIWVVILTFITMVVEIIYGHLTGSMALLADGWHMGSHVGALGISVIAYQLARSHRMNSLFTFGAGKFIPLGGYTSAILLGIVALLMGVESFERFLSPQEINFNTAIYVAVIGLVVNLASALLLWDSHDHHHHDHGHHQNGNQEHVHDYNHKSALIHVIADALTSVFAIVALLLGKYFGWNWADPVMGIVGAVVILRWAYSLIQQTGWELLDGKSTLYDEEQIRNLFCDDQELEIVDLHIWRIAPNAHAGEMTVMGPTIRGSAYYRERIQKEFKIDHLTIEERTLA